MNSHSSKRWFDRYLRYDAILSATRIDVHEISRILLYRDWYERMEDAASELGFCDGCLSRLIKILSLSPQIDEPFFDVKRMTDSGLLDIRWIGPMSVEVLRRADQFPEEPLSCLTESERRHILLCQPDFDFGHLEQLTKILG